jgi:segregation and condensation protein B
MSDGGTPGPAAGTAEPAAAAGEETAAPGDGEAESTDGVPGDALTEAQLEALLFVAERPLARRELGAITGASAETIDARLGDLQVALASRGLRLVLDGERVALATAPEAGRLIGRYIGREPARLSPATLETLAIVAYRQPATKSAIERIRGVDADYAIRSLVHRRLVVELGRSDAAGRPILYGTGMEFLERFGLTSLDDLPVVDAAVAERLTIPEANAADAAGAADAADAAGAAAAAANVQVAARAPVAADDPAEASPASGAGLPAGRSR